MKFPVGEYVEITEDHAGMSKGETGIVIGKVDNGLLIVRMDNGKTYNILVEFLQAIPFTFRKIPTSMSPEHQKVMLEELQKGQLWQVGDDVELKFRRPFEVKELFPPVKGGRIPSTNCTECGAYVTLVWQTKHTEWHNKIADL